MYPKRNNDERTKKSITASRYYHPKEQRTFGRYGRALNCKKRSFLRELQTKSRNTIRRLKRIKIVALMLEKVIFIAILITRDKVQNILVLTPLLLYLLLFDF